MVHIIIGLFFISLGIWGVFDEWYYVVDCVKGSSSVMLIASGLIGIFAGLIKPNKKASEASASTEIDYSEEIDPEEDGSI